MNDGDEAVTVVASFSIPAPTVSVGGQIGNGGPSSLPPQTPPPRRSRGSPRQSRAWTGPSRQTYCWIMAFRLERLDNIFTPTLSRDARGLIGSETFNSFSFQLAAIEGKIDVATLRPGDSVVMDFQYNARGTNGFGETGFLAAIGDPFDITGNGASMDIMFADCGVNPPPPSTVPPPASLPLLLAGLAALAAWRGRQREVLLS